MIPINDLFVYVGEFFFEKKSIIRFETYRLIAVCLKSRGKIFMHFKDKNEFQKNLLTTFSSTPILS